MADPSGEIRLAPSNTPMTQDQIQLSIADGFYAKKAYEMAAPEYEKYLGLFPGGADKQTVLFRLAESYRRTGTLNAARSTYQSLLDQFGAGEFVGPASYRLAEIFYADKNYNSAVSYYAKASVRLKDPKLANAAKFFTARCHEALGQKRDARVVYQDLVATPQDNPFLDNCRLSLALLLKGEAEQFAGNDSKARVPAEALKQMESLAQSTENPELRAQATVYAGLWQIEKGENAKGEALLKKALDMPDVGRFRDAAQFGLIQILFNAEKYQEVIDRWSGGAKEFGAETRPQVTLLAAKAYRAIKNSDDSTALFRQVVQEVPNTVFAKEAAYELLINLYRANDPNLVKEIDAYLAANPEEQKRDQIVLMKAEALFKKQEFNSAAPLYDVLGKSRQLTGLMKAEVLMKLGWCYIQTRENDRAIKAYTELIDGFPTFKSIPAARLQRAMTWLRLNNNDAAMKDLRDLVDKYPKAREREPALLQLGRMLGQRGDSAGMIDSFKIYLRDYPNASGPERAEANFWIGMASFDTRSYKEAIEPLRNAIAGNKDEYFERASLKLMLCSYYLEDKEGCGRDIDAYQGGGAKGQVPYEVLHWIGKTYHDEAKAAFDAGHPDIGAEKYKAAVKYLGMLAARDDVKPEDLRALGRSALALSDFAKAVSPFTSYLAVVKDPAPRAEVLNDRAQALVGLFKYSDAQGDVDEGLKLQPDGDVNAKLRVSAGDIQAAQSKWLEAAKIYENVTAVIDDEAITPRAGEKAVEAYRKAGMEEDAKKAPESAAEPLPGIFPKQEGQAVESTRKDLIPTSEPRSRKPGKARYPRFGVIPFECDCAMPRVKYLPSCETPGRTSWRLQTPPRTPLRSIPCCFA
jgi:tetratricopeptide (TPR) repeat protein